ncbi:MAG: NmrA family NAD(P)-binding protein [Chitinispirillales bacterium]|jgi:uncharacterized protein YbjT (DUF2867 family)|nr:NmrA family NAD(P)-binding protein [Chitinispirillales bacterium]
MSAAILITEPQGVVEQEIVRQLRSRGFCVKLAVHDAMEAAAAGVEYPVVPLDYSDYESCRHALEGVESVFLGLPVFYPAAEDHFQPFIETAVSLGINHIVGLGSIGQSKSTPLTVIEKRMLKCGTDFTLFRSNIYMQHFMCLAQISIRTERAIRLPAGEAAISFVDFRDIAAAAVKLLSGNKHRNRVYNLTGPQGLDHFNIADMLTRIGGARIRYEPTDHNASLTMLRQNGWDESSADLMIGLYEIGRHGWLSEVSPDLGEILGQPPATFERFLMDYKQEIFGNI